MDEALFSETVDTLPGRRGEPRLLLRRQARSGPPVLYIHGATFPSALSVGYRFEGMSWMDDLASRGFDVWAFDFAGYGGSDRPAGFDKSAAEQEPIGRAENACEQLARVIEHIVATTGRARLSLIAHSWGSIVAGLYATRRPDRVDRLVLFGPIAQRDTIRIQQQTAIGGWRPISIAQQLARFIEDIPADHESVLIEPALESWGPAYLATDPDGATRQPTPSVKLPAGPSADIQDAWSGRLGYDPSLVTAPTLIVRGEWDSLTTDADAAWLLNRLGAVVKRDVKIPQGTHLMHLERSRRDLFDATASFLNQTTI